MSLFFYLLASDQLIFIRWPLKIEEDGHFPLIPDLILLIL